MFTLKNLRAASISVRLLIAFLMIALIPVAIVTVVSYTSFEQSLQQAGFERLTTLADGKARQIETYAFERQSDVAGLARSPEIVKAVEQLNTAFQQGGIASPEYIAANQELRPFLTQLTEQSGFEDLYLISPEGDALFSADHEDGFVTNYLTGPDSSTELAEVFDLARTLLQTSISDFSQISGSEEVVSFIAAPVIREGLVIGVAVAEISNREIGQVVNDLTGLGETGETVVAAVKEDQADPTANDEIIFLAPTRYDPNAAFTRTVFFGDALSVPLQNAVRGIKGVGAALDYRGIETIAAGRFLPTLGWGMVVKIDTSEAFVAIITLRNTVAIVAGFVAIGVLIVALRIARSISRPIVSLTASARQISTGDFNAPITVEGEDEIGQLADTFRSMTGQLNDLIGSLEERVASRTRDLQTVTDVNAQISTILEENRLLQDVADLTKERFRLYHAHIYLLNDKGDTLVLTAGAGHVGRQMVSEKRIIALNNPQSIVAGVARSRRPIQVNDVRQSPTFLPHPLLPDTCSELAVPLIARGQLLGVLDVQSAQAGYFAPENLSILELMAGQIATAISNARLYETADRTSRHERALGVIDRKIQEAVNMDEILQTTVRELGKALRVPYTAIELRMPAQDDKNSQETE